MIEELIQAAAAKIQELWPGSVVYSAAIPQDAGGAYYVGAVQGTETAGVGRRRRLRAEIEVRYYLPQTEPVDFAQWAGRMLDGFRTLSAPLGGTALARDQRAEPAGEGGYHALRFAADLHYTEAPEAADMMERLKLEPNI